MGHRLSRIVTRTGDDGTTGLADGSRLSKASPRIEALGSVDELNSQIGVVLATPGFPAELAGPLRHVQHDLFDLGGELSIPGHRLVAEPQVAALEQAIERFNAELPPLKEFVLPGGGPCAAHCHVARTAARRAERACWALAQEAELNPLALAYLNRLSDLLFVMARLLARRENGTEVLWDRQRLPGSEAG